METYGPDLSYEHGFDKVYDLGLGYEFEHDYDDYLGHLEYDPYGGNYDHHFEAGYNLQFPHYASGGYGHLSSPEEYESEEHYVDPYYDPMPNSFNYAVYKRFNGNPYKHHSDTSGDTIPLHDSSSDGHLTDDSHLSFHDSDGFHVSNSTSDRGEITDPATDSADSDEDRRDTISELKAK